MRKWIGGLIVKVGQFQAVGSNKIVTHESLVSPNIREEVNTMENNPVNKSFMTLIKKYIRIRELLEDQKEETKIKIKNLRIFVG